MGRLNPRRNKSKDGNFITNDKNSLNGIKRNFDIQHYKGIPLKQIDRGYGNAKARRFTINHTNQNIWIPSKHLEGCGTIKPDEDIDYVFDKASRQMELAGLRKVWVPINIKELI